MRSFNDTRPNLEVQYSSTSFTSPDYEAIQNALYKLTGTGPRYPGTFEHYAASIIHKWQETTDDRLQTLADALFTLGMTKKIGTEKIGDIGIELQVGLICYLRRET